MTWRVPDWWQFILLTLGAYRLLRLATLDDITHPLRVKLYGLTDRDYQDIAAAVDTLEQDHVDAWDAGGRVTISDGRGERVYELPPRWRFYLAKLGHCSWCAGFWITIIVWIVWLAWPHWTLIAVTPLALAAVASLIQARVDQ